MTVALLGACLAVLFALGAWWCIRIGRRPKAHPTCFRAVAFLLAACAAACAGAAVHVSGTSPPLRVGIYFLVFGLAVVSVVLGVSGWADYRRNGERYRQGFWQVHAALMVSATMLVGIVALAAVDSAGRSERGGTDGPDRRALRSDEVQRFDALGFYFIPPGPAWRLEGVQEEARSVRIDYRLAPRGAVSTYVYAERVDAPGGINLEQALAVARDSTRRAAGPKVLRTERAHVVNGLRGQLLEFEGTLEGRQVLSLQWIYVARNVVYEVTSIGPRQEEQLLRQEAATSLGGFHLIEPE